jgi:PAS domain S-box-containing protein
VATLTRRQKSLVLIRAREVAANLAVPISLLDAEGNLVFFNEAAEAMHGMTFEEAGELPAAEWPDLFATAALEDLPAGIALFERRPVHTVVHFTGADDVERTIAVTAFPLVGREGELFGVFAIFWHLSPARG